MVPLFGSIPGGPEMLIVLVVMLLMLSVPLAFGVGLFLLGRWSATRGSDGNDAQLAALRRRVDELEAELEATGDEADETADETTPDSDGEPAGRSDDTD